MLLKKNIQRTRKILGIKNMNKYEKRKNGGKSITKKFKTIFQNGRMDVSF